MDIFYELNKRGLMQDDIRMTKRIQHGADDFTPVEDMAEEMIPCS